MVPFILRFFKLSDVYFEQGITGNLQIPALFKALETHFHTRHTLTQYYRIHGYAY